MVGLLNWLTGCNEPKDNRDFQDDKFKAGQIWKYNTRQGEENSIRWHNVFVIMCNYS